MSSHIHDVQCSRVVLSPPRLELEPMTRRPTHSGVTLIVAAIQLALGLGLSHNLVLCRGANGHVAVETVSFDDCQALPVSGESDLSVQLHEKCGDCTDTPLLIAIAQPDASAERRMQCPPQMLSLAASAEWTVTDRVPKREPAATTAAVLAVASRVRRSIILLV